MREERWLKERIVSKSKDGEKIDERRIDGVRRKTMVASYGGEMEWRKGRRWRREKKRCAVKMVEGVNEGWGDYCLIDNAESQYKERWVEEWRVGMCQKEEDRIVKGKSIERNRSNGAKMKQRERGDQETEKDQNLDGNNEKINS